MLQEVLLVQTKQMKKFLFLFFLPFNKKKTSKCKIVFFFVEQEDFVGLKQENQDKLFEEVFSIKIFFQEFFFFHTCQTITCFFTVQGTEKGSFLKSRSSFKVVRKSSKKKVFYCCSEKFVRGIKKHTHTHTLPDFTFLIFFFLLFRQRSYSF
jgi:hypothetical protein